MHNLKIISFEENLVEAYLIKREKRFFVQFSWENEINRGNFNKDELRKGHLNNEQPEQNLVAHTNNTGSMLGLLGKGRKILLSKASNPKRKLAWTLEAVHQEKVQTQDINYTKENWIGVNTSIPNKFLQNLFQLQCEFPEKDILPWAKGYTNIRMEATNGESRLDALIYSGFKIATKNKKKSIKIQEEVDLHSVQNEHTAEDNECRLWVECKSVTLVEDSVAAFPDAVSERGTKHLETLMRIVREESSHINNVNAINNVHDINNVNNTDISYANSVNNMNTINNVNITHNVNKKTRAAMLYIIQRTDGTCFAPADYIDRIYSEKLLEAFHAGVEIYAIIAKIQKDGIYYGGTLPLAPCFFVKK